MHEWVALEIASDAHDPPANPPTWGVGSDPRSNQPHSELFSLNVIAFSFILDPELVGHDDVRGRFPQ